MKEIGRKNLTERQRILIKELYDKKTKIKDIAFKVGVCERTIYRELSRGCGDGNYNPQYAQKRYDEVKLNKGSLGFFEINVNVAEIISKYILEDKMSVIQVIEKLKEQNIKAPSRQTIYANIDRGMIPNVTRES